MPAGDVEIGDARNFGAGEPFGTATRAVRCRFEICYDSRHAACVVPPVLRSPQQAEQTWSVPFTLQESCGIDRL